MTKRKLLDDDNWGLPGFIEPVDGFDFDVDVEQYFGDPEKPEQHEDALALRSNVVGRDLTSPALSRFYPASGAVAPEDEDILLAAVTSDAASPQTRDRALQRLDYSAVAQKDKLLRSRLTAWRFEVVLSLYAYSGRTGKTLSYLKNVEDQRLNLEAGDPESKPSPFSNWFDDWSKKTPLALRLESRKRGLVALWQGDGTIVGVEPLSPAQWGPRLAAVNRIDPWKPPKTK